MDAREQKAQEIVAGGKITLSHGYWLVPSQSGGARHKVYCRSSCQAFVLSH